MLPRLAGVKMGKCDDSVSRARPAELVEDSSRARSEPLPQALLARDPAGADRLVRKFQDIGSGL